MSEPTQDQKRWLDIIKNESYKIGHLAGFKDLTPLHHKWFKKMLFNKDTYVLKAHRGSYKCMNPGTQVMMADYSNKAIKDIQIGEYVMGWDGTPRKVLDKHSGRSPMYRVTLNKNGEYYECNNNHILSLYSEIHLADLEKYFFKYYKGGYLYNIEIEDFLRFENKKVLKHFKVNKTFNEVIPFDFSIISIGTGDFVGIVVEGDGMFLLDNFLVIHNTSVLELYIATTMILFPNKTILFVRKTDDDVKEVIKKVGDILKTPVFQQMGMVLNGIPLEIVKNTAFAIETNYRTTKTIGLESQLLGVGLKSSLTGKHAHILIVDDICFVAGTKIATPLGDKNIEDLKVGDLVLTPFGYKRIKKTTNRKANVITNIGLTGTYNHPIYNLKKNKFDFLSDMQYNDCSELGLKELLKWKIAEILLSGMEKNGNEQVESIISCGQIIKTGLVKCCIEQYGKNIKGKYLKAMKFIIKTIIQTIITLITWNVYQGMNIIKGTCLSHKELNNQKKICTKKSNQPYENGKNPKQDKNVLKKWGSTCKQRVFNDLLKRNVRSVEQLLKCIQQLELGFVGNVEKGLFQENITKKEEWNDKRNKTNKNEQTVYNIEVENTHYYYANGILVHNCNTEDRRSRVEREYTKQVWYELNSNIKMPNGTVISTGTTWHVDDVFSVMPPAEIYTCYETGLLSDEQINKIKSQMPPALFAANYELRFVASEDCMFYTPAMVDELDYFDEENKITYFDLLKNGICFLDAGYGGSDYTAFVTMNRISGTDDYIAYGRCWRKHVNDCIPDIENIIKKYHLGTLKLENNGDKGYLAREFKYRGIRVATYHERMNKYTKISTYLYRLWKNIKWTKQTDEIFIGQILDYTEMAEHDDCADVTANASRFYIGGCKVVAMNGINI